MPWNVVWLLAFIGWALTLPASARECAAPAVTPYAGSLFDAMAQTDQNLNGKAAIATAKSVGITRMALFARVHKKQDGRHLVNRLALAHPDFVTVGAPKLFDMRRDLHASYVDDVLAGVAAKHYAFVGEILYTHGDKAGGEVTATGERYIDPTGPETKRLVEGLRGRRIPIMTHWEVYDWARDWPEFDKLYGAYPKQIFIWPHLGFARAQQAIAVLSVHPNVWATLSKKEENGKNGRQNLADREKGKDIGGPVSDQCGNLKPGWRDVLVRFSDRLMFATDAHKKNRWASYASIVRRWRVILAQLPPDAASKIAYDNAARLYGH
jgi:Amidohydrolase